MIDKRGQGLSTNAIILIILGLVVLVVLILGFTLGWNNLRDFVVPSNNIDSVAQSCQTACLTDSNFDFCSVNKTVNDGTNEEFEATCFQLANDEEYQDRNYGIDACPSISCS